MVPMFRRFDGTVRVWRTADGTPAGEPLTGHRGAVTAVAAGTLPDGTPVIISGGSDGTVRVWRTADGTPVGEPLTGHDGPVTAVAAGTLPDGTPVVISGGDDRTVRVWRTADGTPVVSPLDLPEKVEAVAVDGNVIINAIITVAGADITVHQPALPRTMQ
jgi:WD40 repeat protein